MLPQPVDTCCALFCSFAAFETWSIFRLVRVFVFLALSFPYCFWPLNMGCKNSCSTDPHRLGTSSLRMGQYFSRSIGLSPRYTSTHSTPSTPSTHSSRLTHLAEARSKDEHKMKETIHVRVQRDCA